MSAIFSVGCLRIGVIVVGFHLLLPIALRGAFLTRTYPALLSSYHPPSPSGTLKGFDCFCCSMRFLSLTSRGSLLARCLEFTPLSTQALMSAYSFDLATA